MSRALCFVALVTLGSFTPTLALAQDAEVTQGCIVAYERAGEQRKVFKDAVRARDESAKCVATCPAALADECRAWLTEESARISSLEIVTSLPRDQVVVRVDGAVRSEPVIELNAGPHDVAVAVPGQPPWAESLTFVEGQRLTRTVSTVTPEPSSELWIASIVVGGFAAASLGSAGVLAVLGHLHASDLRETCAPECESDDVAVIEREWLAAGILTGVGAAAGVAAGVMLGVTFGDEVPATLQVSAPGAEAGASVRIAF